MRTGEITQGVALLVLQSVERVSHHDLRRADARRQFEAAVGAGGGGGSEGYGDAMYKVTLETELI